MVVGIVADLFVMMVAGPTNRPPLMYKGLSVSTEHHGNQSNQEKRKTVCDFFPLFAGEEENGKMFSLGCRNLVVIPNNEERSVACV